MPFHTYCTTVSEMDFSQQVPKAPVYLVSVGVFSSVNKMPGNCGVCMYSMIPVSGHRASVLRILVKLDSTSMLVPASLLHLNMLISNPLLPFTSMSYGALWILKGSSLDDYAAGYAIASDLRFYVIFNIRISSAVSRLRQSRISPSSPSSARIPAGSPRPS